MPLVVNLLHCDKHFTTVRGIEFAYEQRVAAIYSKWKTRTANFA